MKKWTNLLASAFLLIFVSCNEMDKYYENERHSTSVSVGNAWDYLSERGNFTNFLAGVEKSGYKSLVSGTGLATIFAPDDEAFAKWLSKHGYGSIDAVPADTLKNVITYHLLYYAFNPDRFMAYSPDGVDSKDAYIGLYHKYRTKSRDAFDVIYDPAAGKDRKIYRYEKFIPVLTPNLYQHLFYTGSTGKANYDYFFGEGLWQGDEWVLGNEPYFRVANAGVKEYGIITDNGYIYTLDEVAEPLKTIYQVMDENENYSLFTRAYDRFRNLVYDEEYSQNYNNSDSIFIYNHIGLPSIAREWVATDPSYLDFLSRLSHTVFAPSNAAMQEFFDTYWAAYYNDIEEVKYTPLMALMGEQIGFHRLYNENSLSLPTELNKGNIVTGISSTVVELNSASDILSKDFCSNGILYGVNELVATPKYFSYVTAPAFMNPAYNMYLLLMTKAGLEDLYTATNREFHVFYPTDAIMKNTTIDGMPLIYENPRPHTYGYEDVTYSDGEGTVSVNRSAAARIVRSQVSDKVITVQGTDEKIFKTTYESFNYLYMKGDSIFSTATYNQHFGHRGANDYYDMLTVEEITSTVPGTINGHVYELKGDVTPLGGTNASALLPETSQFQSIDVNQSLLPWEFLDNSSARNFYTTGISASLNDSTGHLDVFETIKAIDGTTSTGELPRFIVFALTAEATTAGYTDKIYVQGRSNVFKRYMPNLFVSVNRSRLYEYPFPGDGLGTRILQTYKQNAEGVCSTIQLDDMGTHLQLTDSKGRTAKVVNSFPYIYNDCAIYVIDNYLDFGDEFNKVQ
ncbi:MAG: fasciclin domain-containing protein [Coprobacter sp.]|nr:fasciclin domain-containing protein [Coprobacter sp.]